MQPLPLSEVYKLIEPGPVVLLATRGKDGQADVMTMSWHMMVDFEPPLIACIVSAANHSFTALRTTGECVIAIPDATMAEKVVAIGNCSGRDGDKLARLGIETADASQVRAPLLPQCFANLECRVTEARLAAQYNLFILEVVTAWKDGKRKRHRTLHHQGYGTFAIDGEVIKLRSAKP